MVSYSVANVLPRPTRSVAIQPSRRPGVAGSPKRIIQVKFNYHILVNLLHQSRFLKISIIFICSFFGQFLCGKRITWAIFIRKPFPFLFFFLLDSGPYSTASPEFYIFNFFGIISSFLAFGGQSLWFTSIRSRRRCNLIVLISRCVDPASCQVF